MTVHVPNSAGTTLPRYKAPPDTCDAHIHIYDPRFRMAWPKLRAVANATVGEYHMLRQRLGVARAVVVQPAAYGTENAVTMDAVAQLGLNNARGIAVCHPAVTDTELLAMDKAGIRGLRFTQHDPHTAVTTPDMIEPLAHRVHRLGWHVQLHLRGEQIVEMRELIEKLPGTIVFDHMARLPHPEAARHAAFGIVKRLMDRGNTWVKLSGAYLNTQVGPPYYADVKPIAAAFIEHAPERCVWGSDWPHPTEAHMKPDDAVLFDLIQEWVASKEIREKLLVDNPATLYGF